MPEYPIPAKRNLAIAAAQLGILPTLLWLSGQAEHWWTLAIVAILYGITMNSAFAMLHEAQHGILHPNRRVNDSVGTLLTLFFPAPFHLLRQGHLGHHLRNRSDDEAFDFYFEGESRIWKHLQLYGILTGLFWLVIVLGNVIALLAPSLFNPKHHSFDRPTQALLESLNPRYMRRIRLEAAAVFALHGSLIWLWEIPLLNYAVTLCGFGILWSALQYVHHFGTSRDILKGARNLRTWKIIDALWLNHNWHRNHHARPTIPWIYLPKIETSDTAERGGLLRAYLHMWRGPKPTNERVKNRYAGKIIR
jgi:fatty acid desaturase